MKDAHGHGSDSQGGSAAHQSAVQAIGRRAMEFAKDERGGGAPPHQIAADIMQSHIGTHMLFDPDVVAHFSHLLG